MNEQNKLIERFYAFRRLYISEKNYILIISGIIGILAGLAAILLKESVHFIHHHLTAESYLENYLQFFYPIMGLILTVILSKVLYKEQVGHAITDILYSISRKSGILRRSKIYSRLVTSAVTVGFGGSAGLESPIVLSGAAIGSNVAQALNLNYKNRSIMIGCGTAAVISAIFNAPIAGLIFAIEVILVDVSLSSFIPLLIATVMANLTSMVLHQNELLFAFKQATPFVASETLWYFSLAIVCGLVSKAYIDILVYIEHRFEKITNRYSRALTGGIMLASMIVLFPTLYGEGYSEISSIINGDWEDMMARSMFFHDVTNEWFYLGLIILTIFLKAVANSLTVAAGGSGGTFAPSLFLGCFTGFAFARMVNLMGIGELSEVNFALVGMAGVLSGAQYAPLTAIFLIAELTGGHTLFVPLMLVSGIAYSTVSYFNPYSLYARDLVKRGDLFQGDNDRKVLSKLNIDKVIETDLKTVHHNSMLGDLVKIISKSRRNIFPVIDDELKLVGIVTLDDVREIMFVDSKQESVKISSIMTDPPSKIEYGDSMEKVMHKFERTGAWNLPVVDNGEYVGFVSKSSIFTVYRKLMKQD